MANYEQWALWLLLLGGFVHGVPAVGSWLTSLVGGYPYVQMLVGWASVIVALMCMKK